VPAILETFWKLRRKAMLAIPISIHVIGAVVALEFATEEQAEIAHDAWKEFMHPDSNLPIINANGFSNAVCIPKIYVAEILADR
jgi:hypothetical protein